MSHSTVAIFCLHTILGAQALNAATHVKANAKIDADSTFCSGPVMFDHSVRVNGLKDPLRCFEDKFDGALSKMLQLCGDVHGTGDESIDAAKVKAGTWLQYATESTKCSDRWPYMLKIEQGVHSSDTATQQLTLDVLQATVAWSYPLAMAGTSFDDAYEHMDTSADGRLDSSEFKPNFGMPYVAPVVDKLFQIVDGNGDAYITNAELLAYMRGIYPIADISPEAIWPSSIVSDTSIPDIEFESIGDTILNWCSFFHMNEQPVSTLQMVRAMVRIPGGDAQLRLSPQDAEVGAVALRCGRIRETNLDRGGEALGEVAVKVFDQPCSHTDVHHAHHGCTVGLAVTVQNLARGHGTVLPEDLPQLRLGDAQRQAGDEEII